MANSSWLDNAIEYPQQDNQTDGSWLDNAVEYPQQSQGTSSWLDNAIPYSETTVQKAKPVAQNKPIAKPVVNAPVAKPVVQQPVQSQTLGQKIGNGIDKAIDSFNSVPTYEEQFEEQSKRSLLQNALSDAGEIAQGLGALVNLAGQKAFQPISNKMNTGKFFTDENLQHGKDFVKGGLQTVKDLSLLRRGYMKPEEFRVRNRNAHPELMNFKDQMVNGVKEQWGHGDVDISEEGISLRRLINGFKAHPLLGSLDVVGLGEVGKIKPVAKAIGAGKEIPLNRKVGRVEIANPKRSDNVVINGIERLAEQPAIQKAINKIDSIPGLSNINGAISSFLGRNMNSPFIGDKTREKMFITDKQRKMSKLNEVEIAKAQRENYENLKDYTDEQGAEIIKRAETGEVLPANRSIYEDDVVKVYESAKEEIAKNQNKPLEGSTTNENIPEHVNTPKEDLTHVKKAENHVTENVDNISEDLEKYVIKKADEVDKTNNQFFQKPIKEEPKIDVPVGDKITKLEPGKAETEEWGRKVELDNPAERELYDEGLTIKPDSYTDKTMNDIEYQTHNKTQRFIEDYLQAKPNQRKKMINAQMKTQQGAQQFIKEFYDEISDKYVDDPRYNLIAEDLTSAFNRQWGGRPTVLKRDVENKYSRQFERNELKLKDNIGETTKIEDARVNTVFKGSTGHIAKDSAHRKQILSSLIKDKNDYQKYKDRFSAGVSKEPRAVELLKQELKEVGIEKGFINAEKSQKYEPQKPQKITNVVSNKLNGEGLNKQKYSYSQDFSYNVNKDRMGFAPDEGKHKYKDPKYDYSVKSEYDKFRERSFIEGYKPNLKDFKDNQQRINDIIDGKNVNYIPKREELGELGKFFYDENPNVVKGSFTVNEILSSSGLSKQAKARLAKHGDTNVTFIDRNEMSEGQRSFLHSDTGEIVCSSGLKPHYRAEAVAHELEHKYQMNIDWNNPTEAREARKLGLNENSWAECIKVNNRINNFYNRFKKSLTEIENKPQHKLTKREKRLKMVEKERLKRYNGNICEQLARKAGSDARKFYQRKQLGNSKENYNGKAIGTKQGVHSHKLRLQGTERITGNNQKEKGIINYFINPKDTDLLNKVFEENISNGRDYLEKISKEAEDYKIKSGKLNRNRADNLIIEQYASRKFNKKFEDLTKEDKLQAFSEVTAIGLKEGNKSPFYVPHKSKEQLLDLDDLFESKSYKNSPSELAKVRSKATKNNLETNINKIADQLSSESIRIKNSIDLVDSVKHAFGEAVDLTRKDSGIKEGYVGVNTKALYQAFANNWSKSEMIETLQRDANLLEELIGKDITKLYEDLTKYDCQIPRHIYDQLFFGQGKTTKVEKALEFANDNFKRGVLGLSPKWFINNRIGNAVMMGLKGVNVSHVIRALYKDDKYFPEEILGNNVLESVKGITTKKYYTGNTAVDAWLDVLGGKTIKTSKLRGAEKAKAVAINTLAIPGKVVNKLTNTMFAFNQKFENLERKATYLKYFDKQSKAIRKNVGQNIVKQNTLLMEEALKNKKVRELLVENVEQTLGDYISMTPAEKRFLKQVVPFYSWYRTISRYAYSLPTKDPIRVSLTNKLGQIADENNFDDDDLKDYQKGSRDSGLVDERTGKPLVLNYSHSNPLSTFGETADNAIGIVSPFITNALEAYNGKKFFLDTPLSSKRYISKYNGGKLKYYDTEKQEFVDQLPASEKFKYYGLSTLRNVNPMLKGIERGSGYISNKLSADDPDKSQGGEFMPYDKLYDTSFGGYNVGDKNRKYGKSYSFKSQLLRSVLPLQEADYKKKR